jgi:P27 family predicted phage terminase small subunit
MARYPKSEQVFYPDRAKSFKADQDLSPVATAFWKAVAPELVRQGVLAKIDRPAFRALCRCYGLLEMAASEMEQSGCTTENIKTHEVKKHPSTQIYKTQADLFAKLAGQFGLMPGARGKIKCQPKDDDDDFNLVLNKGIK